MKETVTTLEVGDFYVITKGKHKGTTVRAIGERMAMYPIDGKMKISGSPKRLGLRKATDVEELKWRRDDEL